MYLSLEFKCANACLHYHLLQVWNDDLADLAQEMAFDCRDREGDLTAPGSADYPEMAQNRYTTRNSMDVEGGMRVWNRQGDDYDYARGRCDRNRNCDEYVKVS